MPDLVSQSKASIRYSTFPTHTDPSRFIEELIERFEAHAQEIGTVHQEKGLTRACSR